MINIIDEDGKIIESFINDQALYDSLQRRYCELRKKRNRDMSNAFQKGWLFGCITILACTAIAIAIIKLFHL